MEQTFRARLLVFGGTTEARELLELLASQPVWVHLCIATPYGGQLLKLGANQTADVGRKSADEMAELLKAERFDAVIDATHPYAREVTQNIQEACRRTQTPCLRLLREENKAGKCGCIEVSSAEKAAQLLDTLPGVALVTTGSKELEAFTAVRGYQERLFVRVLPTPQVLQHCRELGFSPKQCIAMQGPFSQALNEALLHQIGAKYLITKESGWAGGFPEKAAAARSAGAQLIVIRRPQEDGYSFGELLEQLHERFGLSLPAPDGLPAETASGRESPCPPCQTASRCFPFYRRIYGKKAVMVGAGAIALRRVKTLLEFGAQVTVIAPRAAEEIRRLDAQGTICWERREYRFGDCRGAFLAVAATDSRKVNRQVGQECTQSGVPVSVADCREECTFYFPAVIAQDSVVVGVCAGGLDHGLAKRTAQRIRERFREILPQQDGEE